MKRNDRPSVKRLTINHIAAATLRTDKRAWASLAAGIFLALFLISAMVAGLQGMALASREKAAQRVGYEDIMLRDAPEVTEADLVAMDAFDQIGHVYVTASLTGTDGKLAGWYDETAEALLNRRFIEGRMPENPGEVALEQHVLDFFGLEDARVGDEITLPFTPVDGAPTERVLTLAGILTDQADALNLGFESYGNGKSERIVLFPSVLFWGGEPGFETGRTAVIRVMTLSRGVSMAAVMRPWNEAHYAVSAVSPMGNIVSYYENLNFDTNSPQMNMMMLLCGALILACCVAVAQAMESQLARRVAEIGMLRAVGATRRQIRRIFGRQAWLLALGLSPLSIAAGCLLVWVLSRLMPAEIIFTVKPSMLAPVFVLSVACVFLSASLPLRRASRIMPMSVIRDAALLRRAGRVKSRRQFNPARLIARRQMRIHPTRQVGAMLMTGLMLVCVGLGFAQIGQSLRYAAQLTKIGAFEVWNTGEAVFDLDFYEVMEGEFLTGRDLSQLASLPRVSGIEAAPDRMQVNVQLDKDEPRYYAGGMFNNQHLSQVDRSTAWDGWTEYHEQIMARYRIAQEVIGTEKTLAMVELQVEMLTEDRLRLMQPYVTEGRIDVEALDAGREVLVSVPTGFEYNNIDGKLMTWTREFGRRPAKTWENDCYYAGQTLPITQLWLEKDGENDAAYADPEAYRAQLESAERVDAVTTVGALLHNESALDNSISFLYHLCVVTTPRGAQALGLKLAPIKQIQVYLDGDVDAETEEYLDRRVSAIAARSENGLVLNRLEQLRQTRASYRRMVLTMFVLAAMFFAVTVGMISSNVSRRIRTDQRMIGTLRAVGADKAALTRCYIGEVRLGILAGFVVAAALFAVYTALPFTGMDVGMKLAGLGAMLGFAALCLLCCRGALSAGLQETVNRSIVENIREL